jgi:RNA-splicing ligase RtcB
MTVFHEPLVMFDEAHDVVPFRGFDQLDVMAEQLSRGLGHQNVNLPLERIQRNRMMRA